MDEVELLKLKQKEYRETHSTAIKANSKKYSDSHKEEIKKRNEKYRNVEKNKEKAKEFSFGYRNDPKNKEKMKLYQKRYRESNLEKTKKDRDTKRLLQNEWESLSEVEKTKYLEGFLFSCEREPKTYKNGDIRLFFPSYDSKTYIRVNNYQKIEMDNKIQPLTKPHRVLIKKVTIKTTFVALHRWESAPDPVFYLRTPHRHVFYVTMKFDIKHNDRDIEFLQKKTEVYTWLHENWNETDLGTKSCEDMAQLLLYKFDARYVSVFEDNENGAEVEVCN